MEDVEGQGATQPTGSVDNAVKLLLMLQEQQQLRVTDVSRQLDVARSTAHRLLQQLQSHKFVRQDKETRAYRVGPALMTLAISLTRGLDLAAIARPIMLDLVEELGETVHLSVLRGTEIFFLESVVTERPLRVGPRTGTTLPAYATAAGRVLLADLDREEVERRFPDPCFAPLTPRTISERSQLEEILAITRQAGYASNIGESEIDIATVAVPVRNSKGQAVSAFGFAAPLSRLDEAKIPGIAASLTRGAQRFAALLPG